MKTGPVRTELFRADGRTDGQTDMTKVIFAFRNFANALENVIIFTITQSKIPHATPFRNALGSKTFFAATCHSLKDNVLHIFLNTLSYRENKTMQDYQRCYP
jgi:hypothetical protein